MRKKSLRSITVRSGTDNTHNFLQQLFYVFVRVKTKRERGRGRGERERERDFVCPYVSIARVCIVLRGIYPTPTRRLQIIFINSERKRKRNKGIWFLSFEIYNV